MSNAKLDLVFDQYIQNMIDASGEDAVNRARDLLKENDLLWWDYWDYQDYGHLTRDDALSIFQEVDRILNKSTKKSQPAKKYLSGDPKTFIGHQLDGIRGTMAISQDIHSMIADIRNKRSLNKSYGDTDIISMEPYERRELQALLWDIVYKFEDMGWDKRDNRLKTIYEYASAIMEEISYYNGTHEEEYGY